MSIGVTKVLDTSNVFYLAAMRFLHLYNRGVDKRVIFTNETDYRRFEETIRIARLSHSPKLSWIKEQSQLGNLSQKDLLGLEESYGPPLINIHAYTLMPNHFHIQAEEMVKYGAQKFIQRLGNGYTKYFNAKYERCGHLLESKFKYVVIETEEQFMHLARYIHTNPSNSSKPNLTPEQLKHYPWSSLSDYRGLKKHPFCEISKVMSYFKSADDFWEFTKSGINKEELNLSPELLIDS